MPWRELLRSLALPLLLLVAQQGAMLHELSHRAGSDAHGSQPQSACGEVCVVCLSFAQIGSAAAPQPLAAPLRADLSFSLPADPAAVAGVVQRPAARNRGPPMVL